MNNKAVVALSGGQDSTTCLFWALKKWGKQNVHAVTFNYGQRHLVELNCAKKISEFADVPLTILSVPAFSELGAAALTNQNINVSADAIGTGNAHAEANDLPSTFVPARNLIFLGLLGAYAAQHGILNIVTGVCEADEAGYPDCRKQFIEDFQSTINSALGFEDSEHKMIVHTPLINLNKAQTWELAASLNVLDLIIDETHTCYEGDHVTVNEWGFGCAECAACIERANGFDNANLDKYFV